MMKKMDYQNVKGTQDYLPDSEIIRSKIRRTLEDVFLEYGCKPLETPILNYTELLASKYGGGAEILEEMYTLSDRGERDLALRYDLTIPFAKVIAMNPSVSMPYKRYEIGRVFRDGPIKTGRFREFTQCDVDVVGVKSQIAEAELMIMALEVFKKLNLKVTIQYNNRKLLTGILDTFKVPDDKKNRTILILDKLEKIGVAAIILELEKLELPKTTISFIKEFLLNDDNKSYNYFLPFSKENSEIEQGLEELKELEGYLKHVGLNNECVFNPFLARGLEIYTGTIYEIFLNDSPIKSSIGSGGRYDNAIGGLIGTDEILPTVGISFGLDVIYTALSSADKENLDDSLLDYYIIPIESFKESLLVATHLRAQGFKVELEMGGKKIRKALDKANKEKVKNVIIIGESEIKNNQYTIKDMYSGEESIQHFDFTLK